MSSRSVSDISDANVLSYLKNDPSYEFIAGEVILKINIVLADKIKAEVYVNQDKSLSDLQTLIKHSFLLYFPRELLMIFLSYPIVQVADN
jgi:peptidoglycan biosynthesis protein MviN/MurJ (putative lipid II flippase)